MNRGRGAPRCHMTAPRPAGYSDSSDASNSSDELDITGFSSNKKSNRIQTNGYVNHGHQTLDDWEIGGSGDHHGSESWGRAPAETVHLACMRGNLEKLKEQMENNDYNVGVDEFFNGKEENPLITACINGHLELITYLVREKSANPNKRHHNSKMSALMGVVACDRDEETVLRCAIVLVEAGADVNLKDRHGMTALMLTIKRNHLSVAKYLLEKGADPNAKDPDDRTTLIFAAIDGRGKMCRLLLEKGADIHAEDRHGWTAPDLAQDNNFQELAKLLHIARASKWRPGLSPELMEQKDEEVAERKEQEDIYSVKDSSSIELLLTAAEGSQYLCHFRKHKINYAQFLKLDESQLKEIGVVEVGVRERILDHIKNVQNAEWQSSSIRTIALNKSITSAEAVCMVVNLKDHLQQMTTSLEYLNNRIKQTPLALRYDVERNKIEDLLKFCEKTALNCDAFGKAVVELHSTIGAIQGYTEFQVAGRIPKRTVADFYYQTRKQSFMRQTMKIFAGLGTTVGFAIIIVKCLKGQSH